MNMSVSVSTSPSKTPLHTLLREGNVRTHVFKNMTVSDILTYYNTTPNGLTNAQKHDIIMQLNNSKSRALRELILRALNSEFDWIRNVINLRAGIFDKAGNTTGEARFDINTQYKTGHNLVSALIIAEEDPMELIDEIFEDFAVDPRVVMKLNGGVFNLFSYVIYNFLINVDLRARMTKMVNSIITRHSVNTLYNDTVGKHIYGQTPEGDLMGNLYLLENIGTGSFMEALIQNGLDLKVSGDNVTKNLYQAIDYKQGLIHDMITEEGKKITLLQKELVDLQSREQKLRKKWEEEEERHSKTIMYSFFVIGLDTRPLFKKLEKLAEERKEVKDDIHEVEYFIRYLEFYEVIRAQILDLLQKHNVQRGGRPRKMKVRR